MEYCTKKIEIQSAENDDEVDAIQFINKALEDIPFVRAKAILEYLTGKYEK